MVHLSDLGSSVYYVFANCVRALCVESTSMFVRCGVYRVVRRALETPGNIFRFFLVTAFPFCSLSMGRNSNPVRLKRSAQYYAPKTYIHGRTHPSN